MGPADFHLNSAQARALQLIFDVFSASAEWPSYQYVDRSLHRAGLPSADVIASLPLELARFDRYGPALGHIELTIEGLQAVDGSEAELGLFVRVVRWLARREREYEPPSPTEPGQVILTSTEFTVDEDVDPIDSLSRKCWRSYAWSGSRLARAAPARSSQSGR
jgi:hypothetical protein